jgi:steroid delta-isomerase-like uncharacterized protein
MSKIVNRYFEAFNAGDAAAMLNCVTEDVIHDVNQGDRRTGKQAFADFLAMMDAHYDEIARDLVLFETGDGTRAAAEFIIDGVYTATAEGLPEAAGQTYSLPVGSFFELRAGRIARVTTYYNLADWVRQVG